MGEVGQEVTGAFQKKPPLVVTQHPPDKHSLINKATPKNEVDRWHSEVDDCLSGSKKVVITKQVLIIPCKTSLRHIIYVRTQILRRSITDGKFILAISNKQVMWRAILR